MDAVAGTIAVAVMGSIAMIVIAGLVAASIYRSDDDKMQDDELQ
jgi:hypothetical protein